MTAEQPNPTRLTLRTSRDIYDRLEQLAKRTDTGAPDVLRQALGPLTFALDEQERGRQIGSQTSDQPLHTEIAGILPRTARPTGDQDII